MKAAHAHSFYVHEQGRLHLLPPECKLAAALLFILAVVATPREAFWAFGVYALLVLSLSRAANISIGAFGRRLTLEVPFLAFALLMPFFGTGSQVEVLGISLYREGLWAGWNIVVKGTLGLGTSIVLAATTQVPEILVGMERLKVPRTFTAIGGFMVRYMDLIASDLHRMKVARESRCYDPRWIWQARAVATGAASLFIRSYERGERVFLAMVSRGYEGTMPGAGAPTALRSQWAMCLALPCAGALVAVSAWWGLR